MQVVRAGPDIKEDQRPEVHDRQLVGIDRAFGLFRHKVIHHAQKARGQEEAHRVVPIPPLRHRILHAGPCDHRLGPEDRHRDGDVVHHMQHRDRDDERQVEPVGDVDMRLFPLEDRAQEHRQIGHPDHCQPQVDIPFRLGIFLGLRVAQQIAGGRHHDEQLVAPEHEIGEIAAPEPRRAGALDHVERGRQQRVATKGEDHRAGVQRPQTAEIGETLRPLEIELGEGQLEGDERAGKEAHDAPEGGRDHAPADDIVLVFEFGVCGHRLAGAAQGEDEQPDGNHRHENGVHHIGQIACVVGRIHREDGDQPKHDQLEVV